uniref:PKD domain-containing protein n=1 Tax=Pontiella sp. TaxID=2837462 RepID=UPI003568B9FE
AFGGHYRKVGIGNTLGRDSNNIITEPFGLYFLTDNGGGNYLISNYTEDHYLNNNNRKGGVRFRGEGVSCVRVSPPARMLAPLQEGGLGGKFTVNKVDAPYQPKADAALAVAEPGKGRVIGVFDRNFLWNAGDGTRLSHVDNREFTQRMMAWAAGLEHKIRITGKKRPADGVLNQPPQLVVEETVTVSGLQADLVAAVKDDGLLHSYPEIRWNAGKRNDIRFENDNPNTPEVRVFFPKAGTYTMRVTADDGEFAVTRKIKVIVNP